MITVTNFTPVQATSFTDFIYTEWREAVVKHEAFFWGTNNRLQALSITRCPKCYGTKNLCVTPNMYRELEQSFKHFKIQYFKCILTCVSPRLKSDDPCSIGKLPASQYKGLTSSRRLPSSLNPSAIILLRTT